MDNQGRWTMCGVYYSFPANENHRLSQWLLNNAQKLHEEYPGMLRHIRESLSTKIGVLHSEDDRRKTINDVNAVLQRPRNIGAGINPPSSLDLVDSDMNI